MNYQKIYNAIIERAIHRRLSTETYKEVHHIIPRCCGGTNIVENLVKLTPEEHYVCHQLLVKMNPGNYKLAFAVGMMCVSKTGQIRSNKKYGWVKRKVAEASSKSQKGKSYGYKFQKGKDNSGSKNGMFNKTHSNETKKKMRKPRSNTEKMKQPKTESHKKALSDSKSAFRFKMVDQSGVETIFDNIKDASRFSRLGESTLVKLAGNRYYTDSCRGWKCIKLPR